MTNEELIKWLSEFPKEWEVYATKAGSSIHIWNPAGPEYAYVFTDTREPRRYVAKNPYWLGWQNKTTPEEV